MTDPIDCQGFRGPHRHGSWLSFQPRAKTQNTRGPKAPLRQQLLASASTTTLHAQQKQCNATRRKQPKRLGTVEDLARRWHVSPKTIRNNLSSGRLILGTKILGRIRFDIDEIIEYEKQHRIANRTRKDNAEDMRGGDR
jgi:hypothetical protein